MQQQQQNTFNQMCVSFSLLTVTISCDIIFFCLYMLLFVSVFISIIHIIYTSLF